MTKKEIAKTLNEELKSYIADNYDEEDQSMFMQDYYEDWMIYNDDDGHYIVISGEAIYIGKNKKEIFAKVHCSHDVDAFLSVIYLIN